MESKSQKHQVCYD